MASLQTEPPPAHPSAKSRRRSSVFIAAFVVLQFLVPLTYLAREDASDDRFTWRSLALREEPVCPTSVSLERTGGERESLSVETLIHEDWVHYLEQGRRAVVDAFLVQQCDQDVEHVELVRACSDDRGTRTYSLRCGGGRPHETPRTASR
jgi:hypothetical protein